MAEGHQHPLEVIHLHKSVRIRSLVVDGLHLLQLLLAEQPHQPEEFPEVELAAAVLVHLGDVVPQVLEGHAVAHIAEQLGALHRAHLPGIVLVEPLVDLSQVFDFLLREAVALLKDQHEVEELVEVQLGAVRVPVAGVDVVEYLVQDGPEWRVLLLDKDRAQLLLRDAAAAVGVALLEFVALAAAMLLRRLGVDLLPDFPGENEELSEAQRLRLAAAFVERRLLQPLAAHELLPHKPREGRHLEAENLHERVAQVFWREHPHA
mmetsp:Transcript_90370/g.260369  ORF Transcript_90370/g.260369 Transcript_90370/m.260369 type:complete len:263 (-) Transcript_90370:83-871(-)